MNLLAVARNELVCRLRTEPVYPVLAVTVVVSGAAAFAALWLAGAMAPRPSSVLMSSPYGFSLNTPWYSHLAPYRGSAIFLALSLVLLLVTAIVAPIAASAALNRERDGRAIEALLLTGLNPLAIVGGKLLAALGRTLLVLAAALPPFGAVWVYGGVTWEVIAPTIAVTLVVALLSIASTFLMSTVLRSNLAAVLSSYALLGILTLAGPAVVAVSIAADKPALGVPLLYPSAAMALLSANPTPFLLLLPYTMRDVVAPAAQSWYAFPLAYPFLTTTIAGYVALSGLLLLLSSVLLDPFHPLRGARWPVRLRSLRR